MNTGMAQMTQGGRGMFPAELLKEAVRRRDENAKQSQEKKGIDFMALKMSHYFKLRELRRTKKITQSEDFLLMEIMVATIGGQNDKRDFCSAADMWIKDLSELLGYKSPAKIWRILKSLEQKGLITREDTRSVGRETLGLNPEFWDQILIDSQNQKEQNRHLKLVKKHTDRSSLTNESTVTNERTVREERTNRSESEHENSPRLLKTIQDCFKNEDFKILEPDRRNPNTGPKRMQLADPEAEKQRQLDAARRAGIL